MAANDADDASVEVPCGSCGKVNGVKLAELKREGSFVCASCGEEAWVDSPALQSQLHAGKEFGTRS